MKHKTWIGAWIGGLVIGITLLAGPAFADATRKQCVIDAKQERHTCIQLCQDDFQVSIDSCRGVDHDCAQTARENRDACVQSVLDQQSQCVTDNCAVFVQNIADCRTNNPPGTPERDACIDGQQLLLFQCRDSCRESVQVWAGLKTCRKEFKADIKQCPPAPAPMGQ